MHHPELFDYAPLLLKIDSLAKQLHEACLIREYSDLPKMCTDLVVETRLLRAWAMHKMEETNEL